jgi:hypothetical protein
MKVISNLRDVKYLPTEHGLIPQVTALRMRIPEAAVYSSNPVLFY